MILFYTAGTGKQRKRKVKANPPVSNSNISTPKTVGSTPAPPLVIIPQSFSPIVQHLPPVFQQTSNPTTCHQILQHYMTPWQSTAMLTSSPILPPPVFRQFHHSLCHTLPLDIIRENSKQKKLGWNVENMRRKLQFCAVNVTKRGIALTTPSIMEMFIVIIQRHNLLTHGESNLFRNMVGRKKISHV